MKEVLFDEDMKKPQEGLQEFDTGKNGGNGKHKFSVLDLQAVSDEVIKIDKKEKPIYSPVSRASYIKGFRYGIVFDKDQEFIEAWKKYSAESKIVSDILIKSIHDKTIRNKLHSKFIERTTSIYEEKDKDREKRETLEKLAKELNYKVVSNSNSAINPVYAEIRKILDVVGGKYEESIEKATGFEGNQTILNYLLNNYLPNVNPEKIKGIVNSNRIDRVIFDKKGTLVSSDRSRLSDRLNIITGEFDLFYELSHQVNKIGKYFDLNSDFERKEFVYIACMTDSCRDLVYEFNNPRIAFKVKRTFESLLSYFNSNGKH